MGTPTTLAQTVDSEARALSRLAFEELGSAPGGIGALHRAIADRVFSLTGPPARPVQLAHTALTTASYTAVRGGFTLAGRAADLALQGRGRQLSTTPRGAAAIAAIQGLRGDVLERAGSVLHHPM